MSRLGREVTALGESKGFTVALSGGEAFEVCIECKPGHHFVGGEHERVFSAADADTPADVWKTAKEALQGPDMEPEPCDESCEWWG